MWRWSGVLVAAGVIATVLGAGAQKAREDDGFTLRLAVDEVVVTFHAADALGTTVNDITQSEVRLLDNGAAPKRVVAFDALRDRPLRAVLLLDASESMEGERAGGKALAKRLAEQVLRANDQAMVMGFAYASQIVQPWSGDSAVIARSVEGAARPMLNMLPGTALIDSVFRACYYGLGAADPTMTGNVVVVFSDGEDTTSRMTTGEALRACQRSNTAVYAFRFASRVGEESTGPRTLRELADRSGGRVFEADDSAEAIGKDLKVMETEMRNQYRIVYNPAALKHDGSFHSIELQLPDRVKQVEVRSGYFAPAK